MVHTQPHGSIGERTARAAAWTVFAATCALWTADVIFGYLTRNLSTDTNWSISNFAVGCAYSAMVLSFPVAGVLIATKRPRETIGWLLLLVGACWTVASATSYTDYGLKLHPGSLVATHALAPIATAFWVPAIGVCGTFLLLLFPDGHLPSPRWRWAAYLSAFTVVAGTLSLILTPGRLGDAGYPHLVNPYGIAALGGFLDVAHLVLVLLPVSMALSAASLVVRFRRAETVERKQITWFAAAAAAVAAVYALVLPLSEIVSPGGGTPPLWLSAAQAAALVSFALIPASILVAVMRYHLFDIDVIIRRTLTYAVLVGMLAVGYAIGIWFLGAALQSVTGASGAAAVTLTTLLLWAVFQPLRARVQRTVDRRFARERYDAPQVVAALAGRMRDHVELSAVERDLVDAVTTALQPREVTLWLRGER